MKTVLKNPYAQLAMVFAALMLIVAAAMFFSHLYKANATEVSLSELENEFDVSPAEAIEHYSDKAVLVSASIASVHQGRVTLESQYLLNVQAYLDDQPHHFARGEKVELLCDWVDWAEYPTGYKPVLRNCRK